MRANVLRKVQAHDEGVWATAWVPGHHQLLTGSVDESVKLWAVGEDKLEALHTFTGQALGVISLDVDATGAYAVSSSLDSCVRVFGLEDKSLKYMVERQPTESWEAGFGVVSTETTQIAVAGGSKGQAFTYRGGAEDPVLELALDLPQVRTRTVAPATLPPPLLPQSVAWAASRASATAQQQQLSWPAQLSPASP